MIVAIIFAIIAFFCLFNHIDRLFGPIPMEAVWITFMVLLLMLFFFFDFYAPCEFLKLYRSELTIPLRCL